MRYTLLAFLTQHVQSLKTKNKIIETPKPRKGIANS